MYGLLGAYHDGYMMLIYRGVQSYELSTPRTFKRPVLRKNSVPAEIAFW